jgi:uncharacterized protein (TIGR02594 family)
MKKILITVISAFLFVTVAKADGLSDNGFQGFSEAQKVYLKAKAFEGMQQNKNRKELRNFMKVDPVEIPWCAAFVGAVLKGLGFPTTNSLTAMSYAKYKKETKKPEKGDIVVIRRNGGSGAHVGFFHGFKNGGKTVSILGGNQSSKVTIKDVPTSIVISYRKVGPDIKPIFLSQYL